jgi:hypothetical protein
MKNERCPICEESQAARKANDREEGNRLAAQEARIVWLLDRREGEDKPQLYLMPITTYKNICTIAASGGETGGEIYIDNPDKGFDVRIQRNGVGLNTKYLPMIERHSSPIAERERDQDKILDYIEQHQIPDCLEFKDADYLERIMSGTAPPRDDDLDERREDRDRERSLDDDERRDRRAEREQEEREARADRRRGDDDDLPWRGRGRNGDEDDDDADDDDEDQGDEPERREERRDRRNDKDEDEDEDEPRRTAGPESPRGSGGRRRDDLDIPSRRRGGKDRDLDADRPRTTRR